MKRFRLLVAIDATEAARTATRIAAEIAAATKAHLAVLHVEPMAGRNPSLPEPEQAARDMIASLGVKPEILRRAGDPAEEILAAARTYGCELLVMGSRGRSKLAGVLLGSVSQEVIARATCPVLLVRAEAEPLKPRRRIVLPIEGIEGSAPLVAVTARLAQALDAAVSVVHFSYPGADELERTLYHASRTHGEEASAAAVSALARKGIRVESIVLLTHGGVARAIARFADDVGAELIVMGAHAEPGDQARAEESIAVGHLTKRPVLVTREH